MGIVQLTHWPLNYIMDGVSIGALRTLFDAQEKEKATGILANPHLDDDALAQMGFVVKKG